MFLNSFFDKCERRFTLPCAGSNDRKKPFASCSAIFASSSLTDFAIDDDKSYGLFGAVIGWIDGGSRNKSEIGLAVFAKAFCHILSFASQGDVTRAGFENCRLHFFESGGKFFRVD